MGLSSFRELKVWQRSMELAEHIYQLVRSFPQEERFALQNQIHRAAVSVPSNIAEGHAQGATKSFLRHLGIAFGSLAELETQILLAGRLGYIANEEVQGEVVRMHEVGRMIRGLQKAIKRRLDDDRPNS